MYLYEEINAIKKVRGAYSELPGYITDNFNSFIEIRPYQEEAFRNFITYYENENLRRSPSQVLFHMATGSGKTLIMAGLLLYLYRKGFRNFLFFVNRDGIVKKTIENFCAKDSLKYLYTEHLKIDGETIAVQQVSNFQNCNPDAINICFTTIQGLHNDLTEPRENGLSEEDFEDNRMVLISDEAHHANASTSDPNKDDAEKARTWEYSVERVFRSNRDNVLLEFTATCDLENPAILAKYQDKIVFEYSLPVFRKEKYSKEIRTFRTDADVVGRALQAFILSQYRLKLFQDHKLNIKPVVMFKSRLIKDTSQNMEAISHALHNLTGEKLQAIIDPLATSPDSSVMLAAKKYFEKNNISYDQLAQELKADFSPEHCISANNDKELEKNQSLLNSLESPDNPFRAVFAVDKLNEGWDVLNLFDIVRLYETRDAKNGKPGKKTNAEAQLIGRGARYCPFEINPEEPKFQRKYDDDLENELRVCETLYYHCWNEHRFVAELYTALQGIGLVDEAPNPRDCILKDSFKETDFYRYGQVFANKRELVSREAVTSLTPSIRTSVFRYKSSLHVAAEDNLFESSSNQQSKTDEFCYKTTVGELAADYYSLVHCATRRFRYFEFSRLKEYFPNINTLREFLCDKDYLGEKPLEIVTDKKNPTAPQIFQALCMLFSNINDYIGSIVERYKGTDEFFACDIRKVIKSKRVYYSDPHGEGAGVSQNSPMVRDEWKMDLSAEEWYAFEDNFGTSEEKAFVANFKTKLESFQEEYEMVYLVRNERQLKIFSFEAGERFEPDYLLFLAKNKGGTEQECYQLFVEPKGSHLLETDAWKEDFLKEIEARAIPVKTYVDNNEYHIIGLPFFNMEHRSASFDKALGRFAKGTD